MKLAHIASTTGASFLLAGGAAAMVIFCDGVDLRLVTTAYQQPVQMEYHHAVAAAAAEASQMTQEARQLIGTGTVKKPLPPSQGGVQGGRGWWMVLREEIVTKVTRKGWGLPCCVNT